MFMRSIVPIAAAFAAVLLANTTTGQIVINEVATGNPDYIEIANLGGASVDLSSWVVRSYETRGNSTPCGPSQSASFGLVTQIVVPAGTMIQPGQVLAFEEGGTLGAFVAPTIMSTGVNIFFFAATDAEVWIEDATGTVIDYMVFGDVVIDEFVNSTNVSVASHWFDTPILRPRGDLDLMVRTLAIDTNSAFEWEVVAQTAATQTVGTANNMVVGPFKGYGLGYSESGNCAPFNNTNWATMLPTLTLSGTTNNILTPNGQVELSVSTGMATAPLLEVLALATSPFDIPLPIAGCPSEARILLLPPFSTASSLMIPYNAESAGNVPAFPLPNNPTLSGATFYMQAFFFDPAQSCLLRSTQGLELRIQ